MFFLPLCNGLASIYTQQINHNLRIWYLVHFVGSTEPHKYTLTHIHKKKYTYVVFLFFSFFSKKKSTIPRDIHHSIFKFPCHIQSNVPFFLKLSTVAFCSPYLKCLLPIYLIFYSPFCFYFCCLLCYFFSGTRNSMNYAHWLCYRNFKLTSLCVNFIFTLF